MHIAHVTSFYSAPALSPSSAVRARGIAYRAAGHEFSVIVPGTTASMTWTEYGTVITVPARGAALRRGFVPIPFTIGRALDRLVPDRLEVADRLSFRQLGAWAAENHVPAILFADDVPADWATDRALENYDRVVRGADSAVTSEASAGSSVIVTILPGVDLEIFTPLRHNSALRDTSGADMIVLCAAPLTASGSVSIAIDTIRKLAEHETDAHLVVLGDGPLKSRLKRSAYDLPVQFLSAHDISLAERAEVFATADFALITTGGADGHATALESMASGTPAVMIGKNQRHISFLPGGGVRTAADPAHIAHAITALSKEPVESRRTAARETALPFDAMPSTQSILELHESLD